MRERERYAVYREMMTEKATGENRGINLMLGYTTLISRYIASYWHGGSCVFINSCL